MAASAAVAVAAAAAGVAAPAAAFVTAAGFFVVAVPPVAPPRDAALPSPSSLFLSPEELALSNAVPSVWAAEAFLLFCFF